MIRETIDNTRSATFAILLPDNNKGGMPTPKGTGFFISPKGWFLTAAHVVLENEKPVDMDNAFLQKESGVTEPPILCQHISIELIISEYDIALLKVDFEKNKEKAWLKDKDQFPFIKISKRDLDIAEPVYSFGYPLSSSFVKENGGNKVGHISLSPRATSAIISSDVEKTKMVQTSSDIKQYVLDKALNYGNSGGPIIASETGHVNAFCSRFQPVYVPQPYIRNDNGEQLPVMMPSLYGVVVSLNNNVLLQEFKDRNIPLV